MGPTIVIDTPSQFVDALKWVYASGGTIPAIALVVMMLIRVYRLEPVQAMMPVKARWDSLPKQGKVLLSFMAAGLAGGLAAVTSGGNMLAAFVAMIAAGFSAIAAHHGTKAAGQAIYRSSGKDPEYEPSAVSRLTHVVVPNPTITAEGHIKLPPVGSAKVGRAERGGEK